MFGPLQNDHLSKRPRPLFAFTTFRIFLFLIFYRRPLDAWFDLCGGSLYEFPSHIIRKNLSVSVRIYQCHPNIKNFVFFFFSCTQLLPLSLSLSLSFCVNFFFSLICRLCISLIYLFFVHLFRWGFRLWFVFSAENPDKLCSPELVYEPKHVHRLLLDEDWRFKRGHNI